MSITTTGDVTLEPDVRRVIATNIYFDSVGDCVTHAKSTDEFEAALHAGLEDVKVLRAAETGLLPAAVVERVVTLLSEVQKEAIDRIEHDREAKERFRDGDLDYRPAGMKLDEVAPYFDRLIADGERERVVCTAFLSSLGRLAGDDAEAA